MADTPSSHDRKRFGLFELDLDLRELRRGGVLCRLQAQPFTVLARLVSAQGRIVTREELRRELWGDETFVDFEQGLNYCIRQIRSVLGDDAQSPRYIETIPRRGYRFIAPVSNQSEEILPQSKATSLPTSLMLLRRWQALAAGALLTAIAIGVFLTIHARSSPPLTDTDTIVIADFENSTSDPAFDDSLKEALTLQLEQSPFLNILSKGRVAETAKRMNRAAGRLTFDVAREVCVRSNSKAMLAGMVHSFGTHYLIGLRAVDCQTGDILASAEAEATGRDNVLSALDSVGNQLRRKLGESLASVQRFSKPLPEATTSSLDALKAYSLAAPLSQFESLAGLQRAVQLDPKFAVAYASLGAGYIGFNEPTLASENLKKAYELRDRVTERERFYIESAYFSLATGQLEQANAIYREWIAEYPKDNSAYDNLAFNYSTMGDYEKCAEVMKKEMQRAPDSPVANVNLAGCEVSLGRLGDAEALVDRVVKRGADVTDFLSIRYYVAFLRSDDAAMKAQVQSASGKPGYEDILISAESDTAAYHGRLQEAGRMSARAAEIAKRNGANETAAGWAINDAVRRAEFGDAKGAKRVADEALKLNAGSGVKLLAALAWARSQQADRAHQAADQLDREFPQNTMIQEYWLPTIRAAIELDQGNAVRAVEILQTTAPYELAETAQYGYGTMYPVYIRGMAYLKAGQGDDAAREFQKILDHRSVTVNFPLAALSQLQQARALRASHRNDQARECYQSFLSLWKDADPNLSILKQAKVEYAQLMR